MYISLHQSSKSRYNHSKFSAYGIVETYKYLMFPALVQKI